MIESRRFTIHSQDSEKHEKFPAVGDIFDLRVHRSHNADSEVTHTAEITAEYIDTLGPYVDVIGKASIDNEEKIHCVAKYEATHTFPENALIGELILKRVIDDE